jgi:hypothetical protein
MKDKNTGEPVVFGPPNVVDWKKVEAGIEPNKWDDQTLIGNARRAKHISTRHTGTGYARRLDKHITG